MIKVYNMKKFILMFAILAFTFAGFSQDKGKTQVSALSVTATGDASLLSLISSPSITHFISDGVGISLGIASLEDINIGARYYIKDNNFAYAGYGTGSETVDLGIGRTLGWTDYINIEPRITISDVLNDSRDLGLSLHLNLIF